MFHLEPVGRHIGRGLHEPLLRARRRAAGGRGVRETQLGVRAGETTEDGEVTLRAVECLGGCGYAPVVAVDCRYRHHVKPEDAAAIVEELCGGRELTSSSPAPTSAT